MSTAYSTDLPSQEESWRAAIEGAASIWVQLAMVGLSVNAAMADAWMRGAEAMGEVLARSSGTAVPVKSPALGDEPDPWAVMRQAWAAAAEPWRAWLPLVRFEVP